MQRAKLYLRAKTVSQDETTVVEQRAEGDFAVKEGVKYFMYRETAEGMEGTQTTMKWGDDYLVISRRGTVENRQEFRMGKVCCSTYKTPYLQIPLVSTTEMLSINQQEKKHKINLAYRLDHGGQPYGRMEIVMELEEVR